AGGDVHLEEVLPLELHSHDGLIAVAFERRDDLGCCCTPDLMDSLHSGGVLPLRAALEACMTLLLSKVRVNGADCIEEHDGYPSFVSLTVACRLVGSFSN